MAVHVILRLRLLSTGSDKQICISQIVPHKLNGDFTIPLSFIPFIHSCTKYNTKSPLYMTQRR